VDCQSLIVYYQNHHCQRGTHPPEHEGYKKRSQCMLFVGQDVGYFSTHTRRHNGRSDGQ
jgi:hypothetical protein